MVKQFKGSRSSVLKALKAGLYTKSQSSTSDSSPDAVRVSQTEGDTGRESGGTATDVEVEGAGFTTDSEVSPTSKIDTAESTQSPDVKAFEASASGKKSMDVVGAKPLAIDPDTDLGEANVMQGEGSEAKREELTMSIFLRTDSQTTATE